MENKNIFKALADFQQEVPIITKNTDGYGYKYADLPSIFSVIMPLLKKNKLGFYQLMNDNQIKTVLFHTESGETIESNTNIPQGIQLAKMNEFQVLGSATTYIRRYALSSILGIITEKDEDAQGEQIIKNNNQYNNEPVYQNEPQYTPSYIQNKPSNNKVVGQTCLQCGKGKIVQNPTTGKTFCNLKCWLNKTDANGFPNN